MSRPSLYRELSRAQLKLEGSLHRRAKKKARALGLKGGFNEYVTNLLKKELQAQAPRSK